MTFSHKVHEYLVSRLHHLSARNVGVSVGSLAMAVGVKMASKKIVCLLGNSNKICQPNLPAITTLVRGKASWEPVDKVTHTGQKWDEDDPRLVRFVDRQKLVNPNWAINLIAEVPPKKAKDRVVYCNGGGGPLGHPKVYINLDKPGNHSCGYCGLRFYKEDHHH